MIRYGTLGHFERHWLRLPVRFRVAECHVGLIALVVLRGKRGEPVCSLLRGHPSKAPKHVERREGHSISHLNIEPLRGTLSTGHATAMCNSVGKNMCHDQK